MDPNYSVLVSSNNIEFKIRCMLLLNSRRSTQVLYLVLELGLCSFADILASVILSIEFVLEWLLLLIIFEHLVCITESEALISVLFIR